MLKEFKYFHYFNICPHDTNDTHSANDYNKVTGIAKLKAFTCAKYKKYVAYGTAERICFFSSLKGMMTLLLIMMCWVFQS